MSDPPNIKNGKYNTRASDARPNHASQHHVSLLSIGVAVPAYSSPQNEISQWMAAAFSDQPAVARAVRSLHTHSGIERRHSCCPEFLQPVEDSRFTPGERGAAPTTAERMAIYAQEAPALGTKAARRALEQYAANSNSTTQTIADSITHLIVVSCTGFFAPGLDIAVAKQLGLSSTISRTVIGFMGCSAAFNGLRVAHEFVRNRPDARVLVVCVELCSLHIQQNANPAHLIAMSLFGDGASACLVGKAAPGIAPSFIWTPSTANSSRTARAKWCGKSATTASSSTCRPKFRNASRWRPLPRSIICSTVDLPPFGPSIPAGVRLWTDCKRRST